MTCLPSCRKPPRPDDGEDGSLAIYDFIWTDDLPNEDDFRSLMRAARDALSHWIEVLNDEYE